MALTAKQAKFVDEYLVDLNATQAAIRAGYSENRAKEIGYQLLRKTTLAAEIEKKQEKLQKKTGMTQEWVLEQYQDIINNTKTTEPNIARAALADVGKHLGMFKDKLEISGGLSIERLLDDL